MMKEKRELIKLAEGLGLEHVRVDVTGANHFRVSGEHKGHEIHAVAALSGSDQRNHHNTRATLRRKMREHA